MPVIDGAAFSARGEQWRLDRALPWQGSLRSAQTRGRGVERKTAFCERPNHTNFPLGRCYRCQTVIEPYLTPQWFVNIKPLAEPAMQAVRDGRIKIVPGRLVQFLLRLDGEHQGLVHLAADLVGPPDSSLVLQELRIGAT